MTIDEGQEVLENDIAIIWQGEDIHAVTYVVHSWEKSLIRKIYDIAV